MSKIADSLIVLEEEFNKAKVEYDFWSGELEQYGYDTDNAIAAAQYYGQMCAFAKVEEELFEDGPLTQFMRDFEPKLYDTDYEGS